MEEKRKEKKASNKNSKKKKKSRLFSCPTRKKKTKKLQKTKNTKGPIAVKALVFTCVEALSLRPGLTKLYSGKIQGVRGWAYAFLTVAALDLLHDAWFYWTHRWMHSWKPLYRRVHSLHHESTVPTAFTGYAFHPLEGAIVFLNEILVTFLFPIHGGLHRAYHLWTTVIHNGGHAGYEIAPFIPSLAALGTALAEGCSAVMGRGVAAAGWISSGSGSSAKDKSSSRHHHRRNVAAATAALAAAEETSKRARAALNTVRHHDMHHRFPFAHFSLYFTHWDRLLGTEHAGYRAAVEAHFAPKKEVEEKVEEKAAAESSETVALVASSAADAAPPSAEELPSAVTKGGLERLASAMEEYALLSQRKQQRRSGKGGGGRSSSDGGGGAKSSASAAAASASVSRRPRSPGIGAWRPAGSSTEGSEIPQQQQRRSSRLARAA